MKSSEKVVAALIVGVAAGALLGILFAPDKGSETRKKLNEEGKKLADDLKDKVNKVKDSILNSVEEETRGYM